jgi:hypothetical protein
MKATTLPLPFTMCLPMNGCLCSSFPIALVDYPEVLGVDLFDRHGASFGIRKDCLDLTGSQEFLLTQKVKSSCVHFKIAFLKNRT